MELFGEKKLGFGCMRMPLLDLETIFQEQLDSSTASIFAAAARGAEATAPPWKCPFLRNRQIWRQLFVCLRSSPMWMTVGRAYAEKLLDYDIYEAISPYDRDVLLIHGDADSIVPLSYSEKALEVYSSARLEVLPGAGHGFYGNDREQAIAWMLEYLDEHKNS